MLQNCSGTYFSYRNLLKNYIQSVAEFKEFERRFKFKPRLKYG